MTRTLVVTNDFPPRTGGIQSFVHALVDRLPPDRVVVYAPAWEGTAEFDAAAGFPIVRHPTSLMLPAPPVARRARAIAERFGCTSVLFGAAAPLGALAPALRDAGIRRAVGITHGHEAGWALLPGGRAGLSRIAAGLDALTYLGPYTQRLIAKALRPADRGKLVRLHPGVDAQRFAPDAGGAARRAELRLTDRPVVVCVSRLVRRKGQDTLIRALPAITRRVPEALLLIVGGGPDLARLQAMTAAHGMQEHVRFAGGVPAEDLASWYGAGDVFAMPCRTRRGGLDVEGLGMVFLEASACGLPVVAGDSGGAPDAVLDGITGRVVDGESPGGVAHSVASLLDDPATAKKMGAQGRQWVLEEWGWDEQVRRLADLLAIT
ncbi:MAG: glycosyltransferase family 4 protein [Sporichthyaceae bacterium]